MLNAVMLGLNMSPRLVQVTVVLIMFLAAVNPPLAWSQTSDADALYYSEPDTRVQTFSVVIARPPLQALLTIDKGLDPFGLDATAQRFVSLKDVIDIALRSNLNMQISGEDVRKSRWKLLNAYSHFLPDARLGYNWNYAHGHIRLPGSPKPMRIDNPFIIARAGIQYNVFQGGKILFTALQNRNNFHSARWQYKSTTNDVLLEASRRYYDLILNEALLQIRIRAVATSREQLRVNENLENDGLATHLEVLQSRTQLADDRKNLIDQQVARRKAAIDLADYLNCDQAVDLEPTATAIVPIHLIDTRLPPGKLLGAAIGCRPELKSFREQVLSARKGVMIAAAPLFPTVQLSGTEYGIGETLLNKKRTIISAPGSGGSSSASLTGGGSSSGSMSMSGNSAVPMVSRASRQITGLGVFAVTINWTLQGFGLGDYANIREARAEVRQAQLKANQEANMIFSQVRKSYLDQLAALRRTEENEARIRSSSEELRIAQLRLQCGLGKNIDVLRAQQDLTDALVQHAQSSIDFNKAQLQLLHDVGMISRERLLSATPLTL